MNDELRWHLAKLNVGVTTADDFGTRTALDSKLPFATVTSRPAFYDCFSPLIAAYKFKLNLLDENIQKLCGKITGAENTLKHKVRYQNELLEKINQLFADLENKENSYSALNQSTQKSRLSGTGSQVDSDKRLEQLVSCPVDLVSLMNVEKEIAEIEAENDGLIQSINEINEQIANNLLILEQKKETAEKSTPSKEFAAELEALKIEKIKLEKEIASIRNRTTSLAQENAKMNIELIELRDAEFKAAIELDGIKKLTEFQMSKLEEQIQAEDTQLKSLTRRHQELLEHEKLLDTELKNQQLEIYSLQKEISNCEVSIHEQELKISEAKEIKRSLINKIAIAKNKKEEVEIQLTDARETQLKQEYCNKENERRI